MARRGNRDEDWIMLLPKVAGVLLLFGLISPQGRQLLSAIESTFTLMLVAAVGGLFCIGAYRWMTRSERVAPSLPADVLAGTLASGSGNGPALPGQAVAPQTTAEFIQQLRAIDWFQFETLVALAYRKLGYTVTRRGGAKADGGIDLVVEKDGERWAIQCKQWKTWNVGVKAVREFLGALTDAGIQKGIFITLCGYTGEAKLLAEKHGIEIVNEFGLAQMLELTEAVSDPEMRGMLSDPRKFCPKCESEMVLRTARKGLGAGREFWGCSQYPRCRFTMPKG